MRKKIILIISLIYFITTKMSAQDHRHSIGYRWGPSYGMTYKHHVDEYNAYEGLVSFRKDGVQLTFLKEFYRPVFLKNSDRFWGYYGYGMHAGYYQWHRSSYIAENQYYYIDDIVTPALGFDGLFGIEYRAEKLPLTMGLECKPYLGIFGPRFITKNLYDIAFITRFNF